MRGVTRLLVVTITAATLLLLAAIGTAAASGTLGSQKAVKSVITLVAPNAGLTADNSSQKDEATGDENNGKHVGECHPPGLSKHHHKHGTPGHKNHPCGEDGDDSD